MKRSDLTAKEIEVCDALEVARQKWAACKMQIPDYQADFSFHLGALYKIFSKRIEDRREKQMEPKGRE